ncbi:calphotin-like [Zea mays]|uniref:calphotin-like n=1 Tax=Zea mays TaxID=4577 RepID=UPI0016533DB8|nr:calphotin-like [Zea mays]
MVAPSRRSLCSLPWRLPLLGFQRPDLLSPMALGPARRPVSLPPLTPASWPRFLPSPKLPPPAASSPCSAFVPMAASPPRALSPWILPAWTPAEPPASRLVPRARSSCSTPARGAPFPASMAAIAVEFPGRRAPWWVSWPSSLSRSALASIRAHPGLIEVPASSTSLTQAVMCLWSLLFAFDSMAVVLISLAVELLRAHLCSASARCPVRRFCSLAMVTQPSHACSLPVLAPAPAFPLVAHGTDLSALPSLSSCVPCVFSLLGVLPRWWSSSSLMVPSSYSLAGGRAAHSWCPVRVHLLCY